MSIVSHSTYQALMEDAGAPECVKLGETRTHRTRTARKLGCGCEVPAGTLYEKEVWLIDGEFDSLTTCFDCLSGHYE